MICHPSVYSFLAFNAQKKHSSVNLSTHSSPWCERKHRQYQWYKIHFVYYIDPAFFLYCNTNFPLKKLLQNFFLISCQCTCVRNIFRYCLYYTTLQAGYFLNKAKKSCIFLWICNCEMQWDFSLLFIFKLSFTLGLLFCNNLV